MIEQGTKEWFEQRKGRITASNVGAILGLDPYRNADDVLRQMVRETLGAEPEFKGNVATEWGKYNEEGAIAEFTMRCGLETEKCGFFPYEEWLGASPDRLIPGYSAILECKCPYGIRNDPNPQFKSIKDQPHYYAQIQIQLFCTSSTKCHFYQWTPHDIKREDVYINQEWLDDVLPFLSEFYQEYLASLDKPDEYLKPRREIVDTPKAHAMIEEWDSIKEQLELLEERKKDLLEEMVLMAKSHDAEFAGRKLTQVNKAGSVSYAKIVKEHLPKLDLEPYTGKPSTYWKLT